MMGFMPEDKPPILEYDTPHRPVAAGKRRPTSRLTRVIAFIGAMGLLLVGGNYYDKGYGYIPAGLAGFVGAAICAFVAFRK